MAQVRLVKPSGRHSSPWPMLTGGSDFVVTSWAEKSVPIIPPKARGLDDFYHAVAIAVYTYPMRWFGAASVWLQHVGKRTPSQTFQFVTLFLSFPFFKISHFFFKRAYALNQRKIVPLVRKGFLLKVYDRPVASGRVVGYLAEPSAISNMVLKVLRPANILGGHDFRP